MASFHSRSNSFPSQSHPVIESVEDHLERVKASQATSTSSISANLASLRGLHDDINNLIRMHSIQQALAQEQGQKWINELLEGSLRLVDLFSSSMDIVYLTKEAVQDLESSIRRKEFDINAYVASRKRINKMVHKCIKNLKGSNQNSTEIPTIGKMLKEAESLDLSILKSVLILLSGEKEKSYTFLSKFTKTSQVHSEVGATGFCLNIPISQKNIDSKTMLKQLKESEMNIQEIEQGLEALI